MSETGDNDIIEPVEIVKNLFLLPSASSKISQFDRILLITSNSPQSQESKSCLKITASEQLIGEFEVSLNFIDKSLQENETCVIHCDDDETKAVTIAIAFLMWKNRCSLTVLIENNDNLGEFELTDRQIDDLKLFQEMNYTIDRQNVKYHLQVFSSMKNQLQLSNFGDQLNREKLIKAFIEKMRYSFDESRLTRYTCRSCKSTVFTECNLIAGFDQSECKFFLIEPMYWMPDEVCHADTGIISCSRCSTEIGRFSWSSTTCCHTHQHIIPAFAILRSEIAIKLAHSYTNNDKTIASIYLDPITCFENKIRQNHAEEINITKELAKSRL